MYSRLSYLVTRRRATLVEKNGQQEEINKVLPCVHFGFAVNVAGGIGLRVAEK